MASEYKKNPESFLHFSIDTYLEFMVEIIENLNPDFVVERIGGEVNSKFLISPSWNIRYDQLLKRFEQLLEERKTWQGRKYKRNRGSLSTSG